MLDDKVSGKVIAPIALHCDSAKELTLLDQLKRELANQKERNIILAQEVATEKQRNQQLESYLNSFLNQVPRAPSWGSLEDAFPKISSTGSMSGLTSCMVPKVSSYSSISTSSEVQWAQFPKVDSWSSITSACLDLPETSPPKHFLGTTVGMYPPHIRQLKIKTYKEKQRRYREKHVVSRVFNGRSEAAKNKLRVNGKFVKTSARARDSV